eukprot:TRINITY_DN19115_c0_g1_i1.p1 TRINITY_DN19115_c0_g1~~TRINITY_DN19115_c0_g1_i1.p1  ORF type:complete len:1410 (+),score=188.03 TRINITY_DN19115_c0_g1_i1:132-4361(+)
MVLDISLRGRLLEASSTGEEESVLEKFLQSKRRSALRAWCLDFDPIGSGAVAIDDFIRICRCFSLDAETNGLIEGLISLRGLHAQLRFCEIAPFEAANLLAFARVLAASIKTEKLPSRGDMGKAWQNLVSRSNCGNPRNLRLLEFERGATALGFSGDTKILFKGIDCCGQGAVSRHDFETLRLDRLIDGSSWSELGSPRLSIMQHIGVDQNPNPGPCSHAAPHECIAQRSSSEASATCTNSRSTRNSEAQTSGRMMESVPVHKVASPTRNSETQTSDWIRESMPSRKSTATTTRQRRPSRGNRNCPSSMPDDHQHDQCYGSSVGGERHALSSTPSARAKGASSRQGSRARKSAVSRSKTHSIQSTVTTDVGCDAADFSDYSAVDNKCEQSQVGQVVQLDGFSEAPCVQGAAAFCSPKHVASSHDDAKEAAVSGNLVGHPESRTADRGDCSTPGQYDGMIAKGTSALSSSPGTSHQPKTRIDVQDSNGDTGGTGGTGETGSIASTVAILDFNPSCPSCSSCRSLSPCSEDSRSQQLGRHAWLSKYFLSRKTSSLDGSKTPRDAHDSAGLPFVTPRRRRTRSRLSSRTSPRVLRSAWSDGDGSSSDSSALEIRPSNSVAALKARFELNGARGSMSMPDTPKFHVAEGQKDAAVQATLINEGENDFGRRLSVCDLKARFEAAPISSRRTSVTSDAGTSVADHQHGLEGKTAIEGTGAHIGLRHISKSTSGDPGEWAEELGGRYGSKAKGGPADVVARLASAELLWILSMAEATSKPDFSNIRKWRRRLFDIRKSCNVQLVYRAGTGDSASADETGFVVACMIASSIVSGSGESAKIERLPAIAMNQQPPEEAAEAVVELRSYDKVLETLGYSKGSAHHLPEKLYPFSCAWEELRIVLAASSEEARSAWLGKIAGAQIREADSLPIPLVKSTPSEANGAGKGPKGKGAPPLPPESAKGAPKGPPPKGQGKGGKGGKVQPRKPEIKPAVGVKRLFWNSFQLREDESSPTVWDAIDKQRVDVDTQELDTFFADKPPVMQADSDDTVAESGSVKMGKITVLDMQRRQQICVMLARLPSLKKTCDVIRQIDTSAFTTDQVELLLMNVPPAEEVMVMRAAQREHDVDDFSMWDPAEQFVLASLSVPHFGLRLQVWSFENNFQERLRPLKAAVAALRRGCETLQSSGCVQHLLGLILYIGNYLNGGTPRGRADGFAIDALSQMRTVKMTRGGKPGTLVDYLVLQMARKFPEDLDVIFAPGGEADGLREAARHRLQDAREEAKRLAIDAQELVRRGTLAIQDEEDEALLRHCEILSMCLAEVEGLMRSLDASGARYAELCSWFRTPGDAAKSTDEFFGIWSQFMTDIAAAKQAVDQEEAKRKRMLRTQSLRRASSQLSVGSDSGSKATQRRRTFDASAGL